MILGGDWRIDSTEIEESIVRRTIIKVNTERIAGEYKKP